VLLVAEERVRAMLEPHLPQEGTTRQEGRRSAQQLGNCACSSSCRCASHAEFGCSIKQFCHACMLQCMLDHDAPAATQQPTRCSFWYRAVIAWAAVAVLPLDAALEGAWTLLLQ